MKLAISLLIFSFSFQAFAANDLGVVKVENSGFQISLPKSWENISEKKLQAPMVLSSIQKQKEASLVILATTESKLTCKDFLTAMDNARNQKNLLPADKQVPADSVLKSAGATQAFQGEYEIQGKGPGFPVMQKNICYKAKDQIRVIMGAFQKKKYLEYDSLYKEILTSFKFVAKAEPKAATKK